MLSRSDALAVLDAALSAGSNDVYINAGVDESEYLQGLEASIREHLCDPYEVSARVEPPGFPFAEVGQSLVGTCIAKHPQGYWLVYQESEERFLCFWGKDKTQLGAFGVFGSPLYCWSA